MIIQIEALRSLAVCPLGVSQDLKLPRTIHGWGTDLATSVHRLRPLLGSFRSQGGAGSLGDVHEEHLPSFTGPIIDCHFLRLFVGVSAYDVNMDGGGQIDEMFPSLIVVIEQ